MGIRDISKVIVILLFIGFSFGIFALQAGANGALSYEPIQPLKAIAFDVDKAALGERLFHETRLSANNSTSCAHCHHLAEGGADSLATSFGVNGAENKMNSPTIFNAVLNIAQSWDGRSLTLEEQIDGVLHNTKELASNWPDVIAKLSADKTYLSTFDKLYEDGISEQTIKHAIIEFERPLITIDSRFDQYLRGNDNAITNAEKKGYALFKDFGCVACHQGENVGGNLFQKLGVMKDYFITNEHNTQPHEMGRFNVTKKESDRHKFKVPSLRLVTLTAPYLHDGEVSELDDAIRVMGEYQLGIQISDPDIASIISFLHTLVGKHAKLGKPK